MKKTQTRSQHERFALRHCVAAAPWYTTNREAQMQCPPIRVAGVTVATEQPGQHPRLLERM